MATGRYPRAYSIFEHRTRKSYEKSNFLKNFANSGIILFIIYNAIIRKPAIQGLKLPEVAVIEVYRRIFAKYSGQD